MCGLAAILLYPCERSSAEWQRIGGLFTQMLLANQERGRDAAGLALVQRDGQARLLKQPVPAEELVQTSAYREILEKLGPQSAILLGHTRMPTRGTRWNNDNNHPLRAGHVLGIHNGVIENDDQLFARLRLERQAEVDSEIIFRLLDQVEPLANGRFARAVQERVRMLVGPLATLSVDQRRPARLLALKHLRPLCFHYEPALQAVFFSSRYLFLRQAFGRAVVTEALENDHGFVFDALALPAAPGRPEVCFPLTWDTPPGDPLPKEVWHDGTSC